MVMKQEELDKTVREPIEPLTRQEFKDWVAALRSGEYEQGHGSLCEYGKYCCLGVLAKTKNRLKSVADINPNNTNAFYFEYKPDIFGSCSYLKEDDNYYFISDDEQCRLVRLNDSGHDFNEIADFIEEHYLGEEK